MTEPRKRGRPATGNATPGAERQRRYIERLKAQAAPPAPAPDADLTRQLALAREEISRLNQEGDKLFLKIDQLTRANAAHDSRIKDLSKRLDAATQARATAIAETIDAKAALALAREDIKRLEAEMKRHSRKKTAP